MSKYAVHRCRLFNHTPPAIQCMAGHQIQDSKEGLKQYELAVGQENGAVQIIRSSATGFYIYMAIPGSSRRIEDLTWCNDRLFSADLQGDISEYDLTKGTVKFSEDSYGGAVWCLATAFDKSLIAAGCEDGSIKIFDCAEALKFKKSLDRQEGRILSCAFHPNNETLASGSIDVIRIWSFKSGHAIQRIRLESFRRIGTIVWTVKLLSDHTVISGDSNGKVQFWNSKNATLIESFRSHQADILSLCVSKDEKSVYAAGVDPKVTEIAYVMNNDEEEMDTSDIATSLSSIGKWIKGAMLQKHTHDIRSLVILGDKFVSGGVDTNILVRSTDKTDRRVRKVVMFPHANIVHFSPEAQMLLFQCSDSLQLWKLGTPISNDGKPGEEMLLQQQPMQVLSIESRHDVNISCSGISRCGHWIAYSTKTSFRLFRVNWEAGTPTKVSLEKVRVSWFKPAFSIHFTEDSGYMITSSLSGKIFVIKLDSDDHAHISHVFQNNEENKRFPIHLLATDSHNNYLAVGDLRNKINVYNLQNQELHCTLPERDNVPTSISFKPSSSELFVVYQDHEVIEYDVVTKAYTRWCRNAHSLGFNLLKFQRTVRGRKILSKWNSAPVTNITFSPKEQNKLALASQKAIYIIDQSLPLVKENWEGGSPSTEETKRETFAVKYITEFQPLLYAGIFDHGKSMVVVERSLSEIYDSLPPTLYQKKFGT